MVSIRADRAPNEAAPLVAKIPASPQRDADAHLIAAAPDLYAALEQAAEIIRDRDGGNQADETGWADPDMMDAWVSAITAMKKARGESAV